MRCVHYPNTTYDHDDVHRKKRLALLRIQRLYYRMDSNRFHLAVCKVRVCGRESCLGDRKRTINIVDFILYAQEEHLYVPATVAFTVLAIVKDVPLSV